jgi:hypothetical protein
MSNNSNLIFSNASSINQGLDSGLFYRLAVLYYVATIGYQYLIPISNLVGLIPNAISLIVLFNRELKGDMYKYLIAKTMIEMATQISSATTFMISCERCGLILLYSTRVIKIVFLHFMNSFCYTMSSIVEIAMSYDRLRIFKINSNYLIKVNFNYLIIVTVSISALLNIPIFFSRSIINIPGTSDKFTDIPSQFGQSAIFTIYVNMLNVIQVLVPLAALSVLNVLVAIEYRKYIKRQKRLRMTSAAPNLTSESLTSAFKSNNRAKNIPESTKNPSNVNNITSNNTNQNSATNSSNSNKKFTSMVLITSSLFALTRLYNSVIFIWTQIFNSRLADFDGPYLIFTYFGFQFLYLYFASNLIIYTFCNKNFKKCLIKLICCCRNR